MSIIPDDRLSAVRAGIGARWAHARVHMFPELGSTNQWLVEHPPEAPTVVIADRQTKGRGRQGREWASPVGGLYVSVGLPMAFMRSLPPALSLLIGLQLVESLHGRGFAGIRLKWPNDLVVDDAKLAGLLVERLRRTLIVGVGVNVEGAGVADLPPDRQAIGLRQLSERPIDDGLLGAIAGAVLEATTWSTGQAEWLLQERWPVFDALAGRDIVVEQAGGGLLAGRVAGITTTGELRLITDSQERHLQAGECRVQGGWAATR